MFIPKRKLNERSLFTQASSWKESRFIIRYRGMIGAIMQKRSVIPAFWSPRRVMLLWYVYLAKTYEKSMIPKRRKMLRLALETMSLLKFSR